jgi:indole-3-pyruvate monooxygenase
MAHDKVTGQVTEYTARFLVVATGENSEGNIPEIPGLHDFHGDVIHSSSYKSWDNYAGKEVLVIGCGNSGMEIAYDLASHGVETSVVIRSPV